MNGKRHYGILFVNGLVPTRQNKILNLDIMLKSDKEKLWHHPHFDREIYQLGVKVIGRANLECVT
jgi:hypothetical protein